MKIYSVGFLIFVVHAVYICGNDIGVGATFTIILKRIFYYVNTDTWFRHSFKGLTLIYENHLPTQKKIYVLFLFFLY